MYGGGTESHLEKSTPKKSNFFFGKMSVSPNLNTLTFKKHELICRELIMVFSKIKF